jgi:hypothetical protein
MVEDTGLRSLSQGHLQWHDLPVQFHETVPFVSKFIGGGTEADGLTDSMVIS